MVYFWLAIAIGAGLLEMLTPQLVSIWFCVGALISLGCAALSAELWLQIVVFVVSSVALVFMTRPIYKKYVMPKVTATNSDALIGKTAVVIEDIDNDSAVGLAKVSGQVWSALSENGTKIPKDTKVTIMDIQGVKLIVLPVEE